MYICIYILYVYIYYIYYIIYIIYTYMCVCIEVCLNKVYKRVWWTLITSCYEKLISLLTKLLMLYHM